MNVTVMGIGSPFGMDRLGWQVVENLKLQFPKAIEANVNLLCCDRPGMALLNYIKDADLAILVDAVMGGTPGIIRQLEIDQLEQLELSDSQFSSHDIGVAETLTLGAKLNMLPERIVLYGIEVGESLQIYSSVNDNTNNNTDNKEYNNVDNAVYQVSDRIMITIGQSVAMVR